MSQISLKMVDNKTLLNSLGVGLMRFLFSSSGHKPSLIPSKILSLFFVLSAAFFGSTNAFASNAAVLFPTATTNFNRILSAPVAVDDDKTSDEDNILSGSVATNDFDLDGDILTFTAISSIPFTQGSILLNADGRFMFMPATNFNGVVTLNYKVCDPSGLCATAKLTITVIPVNDPPVASVTFVTTNENLVKTGDLKPSVLDIDNPVNTLTFTQIGVMAPIEGTFTLNPNGTYTYTPALGFTGTTAATYKVCDANNACDTSALVISVINVNDPPVAVNDSITILEDTPISNTVASNDSDIDNPPSQLTYTVITPVLVSQGTFVLNTDGTYTFTPAPNFTGTVVIPYKVCDPSGLCAIAALTITVMAVNDPPVANDTSITINEDTSLSSDLKPSVSDPDNPTSTLIFTPIGSIPITQGVLTLFLDGTYTFTSAPNFNGTVVVTFRVCDANGLCDTATLTISVLPKNDKPLVTPTSIATIEDTPTTVCMTINDIDVGETFTAEPCGVNHGTALATITGNQLCVTYSPSTHYNGLDTICFIVCDALGACDTVKIPATVSPVNDKPIVTPLSISTIEDMPATVCTTINDPDLGEIFTATSCGVKNGTATATITGNQLCVTYTPNTNYYGLDTACFVVCDAGGLCDTVKIPIMVSPINDKPFVSPTTIATVENAPIKVCTTINDPDLGDTFTVTPCGVNHGTASATIAGNQLCVTYTPNTNYNGLDTVCFVVCDVSGACDTARIPVTVLAINDKPLVSPTNISTIEDSTATVCTTINDVDLGETFTAALCGVKNGTATTIILGNQLCVTYSPSSNYNGLDTVCVTVCDAGGACDTVKIPVVVSPKNDKPVVIPTILTTVEDTPATVCTTINDPDLGETFTTTLCGVKNGTATTTITGNQLCVTYSPESNYSGLDTICVLICDTGNACDTVKIPVTVVPINDNPVIAPLPILTVEDSTATVCTTINDPDLSETFTATLCGVKNGTATATILGNQLCVTYSPSSNYNGLDTVCFVVCDAKGACVTVNIPIIVKAVNDTPSVTITPITVLKDSTRQICFDIVDNDTKDTHTVTLCGVQKGSATLTSNNRQICMTYTPPTSYVGVDTVCMIVCDSSKVCQTLSIPINAIDCNDQLAPVIICPAKIEVSIMGSIISDPNQFIKQNGFSDNCDGLKLDFNKIIATDDCGTPTVSQISGLTEDSTFREGRHFLTYQALDNSGKTSTCQVEIVISPIQLLDVHKMSICPNENLSLKAKTYSGANYKWTGPRNMTVDSILLTVPRTAGEAVEVYVVAATFGSCTFTDSITVSFRVKPIVNNDIYKVDMNKELSNSVLLNDSTITTQKYTIKVVNPVKEGKLTFNPDGSFLYAPSYNYTGLDNFEYEVCPIDCPSACEKATATLKVFNEKFANKGTNVITPNGDGMNDVLEIDGFNPNAPNNESEIVVFNQWGNVVYRTTAYQNDWRGTFNDNPLPEATYYFIFKKSPDALPLKDFVTIIR